MKWLTVNVGKPERSMEPTLNDEWFPQRLPNASTIVWSVFLPRRRAWSSMMWMSPPGLFCSSRMHSVLSKYGTCGAKREMPSLLYSATWLSNRRFWMKFCSRSFAKLMQNWSSELGRLVMFCGPGSSKRPMNVTKSSRQRRWLMCSFSHAKRSE